MNKSDVAQKIREFLLDSPDVDDNAAPGLKLLRQAAVALEQPTSDVNPVGVSNLQVSLKACQDEIEAQAQALDSYRDNVRQLDVMLNGDNAAAQASLNDIIGQMQAEPEGKLLGYVNSEYVAQLLHGNFDGLDIEITKDVQTSSQLAIYDRPRLTPVIGATSFAEQFVAQVRTMLGFEGTDDELAEACQAYGKQYANMEQAVLDRDEQIAAQDKLIGAVIDAAKSDWQDVDDLPIRVAQLRAAYDKSELSQAVKDYPATSTVGYIEPDTFQPEEVPAPLAGWVSDAIDLAHAVRGDLRPENRIMAKAAENIIMAAPRGVDHDI